MWLWGWVCSSQPLVYPCLRRLLLLLLAAGASADPNPAHHQAIHHGLHL